MKEKEKNSQFIFYGICVFGKCINCIIFEYVFCVVFTTTLNVCQNIFCTLKQHQLFTLFEHTEQKFSKRKKKVLNVVVTKPTTGVFESMRIFKTFGFNKKKLFVSKPSVTVASSTLIFVP
jgi:hypothetical protein